MYDLTTKNNSFLELSNKLKSLGIKNYNVMLKLNDATLIGVNPYKVKTKEEREHILKEASTNIWYFVRELVRIPLANDEMTNFKLNIGNFTQIFLTEKNCDYMAILPRQKYKTVTECIMLLWKDLFVLNSNSLYINKSAHLTEFSKKYIKKVKSYLPKWLIKKCQKDGLIDFKNPPVALKDADKVFTDMEYSNIVLDEFSFLAYDESLIDYLIPSYSYAKQKNKINGGSYGLHIVVAPEPSKSGEFSYKYMNRCIRFTPKMFDSDINNDNMYLINYDWRDLGYSQDWYNKTSYQSQDYALELEL